MFATKQLQSTEDCPGILIRFPDVLSPPHNAGLWARNMSVYSSGIWRNCIFEHVIGQTPLLDWFIAVYGDVAHPRDLLVSSPVKDMVAGSCIITSWSASTSSLNMTLVDRIVLCTTGLCQLDLTPVDVSCVLPMDVQHLIM